MRLVPGSVRPNGTLAGRVVEWRLTSLAFGRHRFSLELEPLEGGRWPTNVRAVADFTDGWGQPGRIDFPVPEVEVMVPTATPPEPTPTTSPPTATPVPQPAYMPLAMRHQCFPRQQHVDVALVVDASSSMAGPKIEAARAAVRAFLSIIDLGRDRAAIVVFSRSASLAQPLTGDAAALSAALDALATDTGTRIDLGLAAALDELAGPRAEPSSAPIVILLSDGQQAETAPVVAEGERARRLGVELFTIGLGADADGALLARLATDNEHHFHAPSADDLRAIYERIAGEIPCR
jgi:uncharacterized protein YegL